VAAALVSLNQYYRWTRVLPAPAALERILEDSGYLAMAATTPGPISLLSEAGARAHVDPVHSAGKETASGKGLLDRPRAQLNDR
jgi:hypothetical protein